jgi:predicted CXXCH cytochrome family protein
MRTLKARWSGLFTALLMTGALSGCADDKIVYRDRPLFETPAATAAGFIGYQSTTSKTPTCGACHVEVLGEWKETKHANAWATLQANAGKKGYCEACHSVNNNGNGAADTLSGWRTTKDARYQDVQCESCHGPGTTHISNPTKANVPLVSMKAGSGFSNGCGSCHSGVHNPFIDEWKLSGHGTLALSKGSAWRASADSAYCQGCHTGQGALKNWGIASRTNYKEKAKGPGDTLTITCAICHDPHAKDNPAQLRYSISVNNTEQNLCMKCHNRRSVPDPTSSRGAHSPEGALLTGEFGWQPPGMEIPAGVGKITTTHGSVANPRLCAGCHVAKYTVTDATGAFSQNVTGHRFLPTPCVDANGAPTVAQPAAGANCAGTSTRSFRSCATSGCHGSQAAAANAELVAENRVKALAIEVNRLVALVKIQRPTEFSTTDNKITTAEGANFNSASVYNATTGVPTAAVIHNPYLVEALLTASIAQLKKDYSVTVVAGLDLSNTFLKEK